MSTEFYHQNGNKFNGIVLYCNQSLTKKNISIIYRTKYTGIVEKKKKQNEEWNIEVVWIN